MATIFGATMATGKYAKSGNDPLSVEVHDIADDEATNESGEVNMSTSANVGESSRTKPPAKRAKVAVSEDDPLLSVLKFGLERVAVALEKGSGGGEDELPEGLWDDLASLPGFEEGHLSHYYAHLVDNPKTTRAFATLTLPNKLIWVTRYVMKHFG